MDKNHTLIRKPHITNGVTVNPQLFNPALEWDTLPINEFSNLGSHVTDYFLVDDSSTQIINISPNIALQGEYLDVNISGSNISFSEYFEDYSEMNNWYEYSSFQLIYSDYSSAFTISGNIYNDNGNNADASIYIPDNAPIGQYHVELYDYNTNSNILLENGFTIQEYVESWTCINGLGCYDPGDGSGLFLSLDSCQNNCGAYTGSCEGYIFCEEFEYGLPPYWQIINYGNPNVEWQWTDTGMQGDYPTAPLNSESSFNGWMMVDSDGESFDGGEFEHTELVSPIINLSDYENVKLEFNQLYRRWQSDSTIVKISNNGGLTWSGVYYINWDNQFTPPSTNILTDNPENITLNVSDFAGSDSVRIKFVWYGQWDYGWQIDDIKLSELQNYEYTSTETKYYFQDSIFFGNTTYTSCPQSQLENSGGYYFQQMF